MTEAHLTSEHADSRFDQLERQIAQVSHQVDRNHGAAQTQFAELGARVNALEDRLAGHSDEQIEQMIDDRLALWVESHLLPMVREVLNAQLKVPLAEISQIKEDVEDLSGIKRDTEPIAEMVRTVKSIRKALIWFGAPAGAVAAVAGAIVILGQVL